MDKSSRPTYVEPSASASLSAAESFIRRCNSLVSHLPESSRLVEPVITPRFVPTCSQELLTGLGNLAAEGNVMVQSHMCEARDQVDWVRSERGKEDFDIFKEVSAVARALSPGVECQNTVCLQSRLLTSRTIQAHCTYLPEPLPNSLSTLRDSGTAIAHCPLSNTYFSHLPFPLRETLDAGTKVGLGSDVAGGYSIDLMTAMRQAVIMSRTREGARIEKAVENKSTASPEGSLAVHWTDVLHVATRGGAEALGLTAGEFKPGVPFDAQKSEFAFGFDKAILTRTWLLYFQLTFCMRTARVLGTWISLTKSPS